MAKSKYSPALFEVINKQKNTGKLGIPKWWKGPGAASTQAADPAEPPQVPVEPRVRIAAPDPSVPVELPTIQPPGGAEAEPAPVEPVARAETGDGWDSTPAEPPPLVVFESGRIRISLSPTYAAVLGGFVLVLMLASYQMGRGVADRRPAGAEDGLAKTLMSTPDGSVLQDPDGRTSPPSRAADRNSRSPAEAPSGDNAGADATADELKVGLHYVLLDKYPKDCLETAEHVQKWLASTHGIQTVLRARKDSYWLIGKEGFDYSAPGEADRCEQYVQHMKSLGRDCRRELIRAQLPVYGFAGPMKFKLEE